YPVSASDQLHTVVVLDSCGSASIVFSCFVFFGVFNVGFGAVLNQHWTDFLMVNRWCRRPLFSGAILRSRLWVVGHGYRKKNDFCYAGKKGLDCGFSSVTFLERPNQFGYA